MEIDWVRDESSQNWSFCDTIRNERRVLPCNDQTAIQAFSICQVSDLNDIKFLKRARELGESHACHRDGLGEVEIGHSIVGFHFQGQELVSYRGAQ